MKSAILRVWGPRVGAGFSDTRVGLTKNTNRWGSSQANCDSESVVKAQKSIFFFFPFWLHHMACSILIS